MRAAEENLRPAVLAAHVEDQRTDAVVDAHHFARDLLVAADHAFRTAEIDHDVTELDTLHHTGDDLALTILELFELAITLGIADLLEDHLLGGLRAMRPNSMGGSGSTI